MCQTFDNLLTTIYNELACDIRAVCPLTVFIGTKREVTAKSAKLTEQIIYADKCRGLTSATNRSCFFMSKVAIHTVKLMRNITVIPSISEVSHRIAETRWDSSLRSE